MPKSGKEHAYGPYENRNGWRVVLVRADGARVAKVFADKAEALAVIADARNATDTRTVGDLVRDYLEHLEGTVRPGTIATTRHRLLALLRLPEEDRLLRSVTPRLALKLYQRRVADGVSPDTHRGELGCACRAFEHAHTRRGWIPSNPFEAVEPVGNLSRGKPQLRVDEARRLLAILTREPSQEATAVLVCLMMGLRAHEVVQRIGRDVDAGGTLLWIPHSKTAAGVRQVAIPSALRGRLLELVTTPEARLFTLTRHALHYHTVRFAKLAGVPRVTPHGLRGTFATLAITAGASQLQALAPQFGHNDRGETMRRHYLAPGAEESANVTRLETVLGSEVQPEEIDAN